MYQYILCYTLYFLCPECVWCGVLRVITYVITYNHALGQKTKAKVTSDPKRKGELCQDNRRERIIKMY